MNLTIPDTVVAIDGELSHIYLMITEGSFLNLLSYCYDIAGKDC